MKFWQYFSFLLLFPASIILVAQDLLITDYSAHRELPPYAYYDAIQNSAGELLLGSDFGLIRYDAEQFSRVTGKFQINHSIFQFQKDTSNNIWVLPYSAEYPIYIIHSDTLLSIVPIADNHRISQLRGMTLYYDSGNPLPIVLDSKSRIFRFNGESWHQVRSSQNNLTIKSMAQLNDTIYTATSDGVYILDNDSLKSADRINKLLPSHSLHAIYLDKDSNIWLLADKWLGFLHNGVFKEATSDFTLVKYRYNETEYRISKISDCIIFGSRNSLFQYNNKTRETESISTKSGSELMGITSIFVDYENNIWLTSLRGVFKIQQTPFRNFSSANGLKYNEVTSIETAGENRIAVAQVGNLAIYNTSNDQITNHIFSSESEDLITFSRIWDMHYDSNNSLWLVDYANGIGEFDGANISWHNFNGIEDFVSITQDIDKNYWFCTTSSVYRLNDGILISEELPDSLLPRKLFPRRAGGIYIASTQHGLYTYHNGELKNYVAETPKANNIYSVCENKKYGVLIGTKTGLYRLDSNKIVKHSLDKLSIDNPIYFIKNGKAGEVWFGTNNGVYKLENKHIHHFILSDGLSGMECNRDAGYLDSSGRFWIGTNGGLSIYNDIYDQNNFIKPKGKIEFLQTGSDTIFHPLKSIKIPYSQRNIFIKLSAFSYIDEHNNKFHVLLRQEAGSIIDSFTTSKPGLRFPSLAPGNYVFEMRVENDKGTLSEETYSALLSIGNPFYGQTWFYIILIIITSGITVVFQKYYSQKKQSEVLEELVKKRTEELQKEIHQKSQYENALRSSEVRYKNLFQNSAFGIYQSTMEGKIVLCNQAFQEMVGAKGAEDLHNLDIEKTFYMENRRDFINQIQKKGIVVGLEKTYRTLDNRIIWVRESARIFINQNGEKIIEGAIEDITANKNAQHEMLLAKEKAENSDRLKSEFLAQMSHEIRTPVNTILSFSSLIKERLDDPENSAFSEYFSAITHGSERLIRTIDSILNLSQLQLGNYEAKFKNINLFEIATRVVEEFKFKSAEKGLNLSIKHSAGTNMINADLYSVSQLIANLVDNSIKYTEKGYIAVHVKSDSTDRILLIVEDSGVGMSETYLKDIFKPFSQEETGYSRRYEGTGLGLSLVKNYCELNNAEIRVESKKGKGSQFTIFFQPGS